MAENMPLPTIPQFFSDKNILITGGSGFLGKLLIEKLLRCCPDVGSIYLLIREKKGKSADDRLKQITDNAVFDKLRIERVEPFKKLKVVHGNVSDLNLGLSEDDRSMLIENIDIVYHAAASVRFDDNLKYAVLLNVRGTRDVVALALEMKKLTVFAHVSTAYTNCDKFFVEEKMYPPPSDWRKVIKMAEQVDSYTLDCLTTKYLEGQPNTYTLSKNLAEHVVYDMCSGRIPAFIYRPSIVVPCYDSPLPGWTDNLNGPSGIIVAVGIGLMRSIYAEADMLPDYIPADVVVKGLVAVTWYEATQIYRSLEPNVYNSCGGTHYSMSTRELVHCGLSIVWDEGMELQLFHPNAVCTNNFIEHYVKVIFFQLLPAILFDLILKLVGKKPMLVKIQRKIFIATMALTHFSLNSWTFVNDKFLSINEMLSAHDVDDFYFYIDKPNFFQYIYNGFLSGRQYVLHEDPRKMHLCKRKALRNRLIYQTMIFLFWGIIIYCFASRIMQFIYSLNTTYNT